MIKQFKLSDREKYIKKLEKISDFYALVKKYMNKGSPIIGVFGYPRSGKTETSMTWAWLFKGDGFNPRENLYSGVKKLMLDILEKNLWNRALVYDESEKDLDIGAWNSRLNRVLNKYTATQAYRKNLLFIIMPFARLVPWIHIPYFNFAIECLGNGWANYYALKSKPADFKGKLYMMHIETLKLPRAPKEFVEIKEEWEHQAKKDILKELVNDTMTKRERRRRFEEERIEILKKLKEKLK